MTGVGAKVSWNLAHRVITLYEAGTLDLMYATGDNQPVGVGSKLCGEGISIDQEVFLLYLHYQNPRRSNNDYIREFAKEYGVIVSGAFISQWFKN